MYIYHNIIKTDKFSSSLILKTLSSTLPIFYFFDYHTGTNFVCLGLWQDRHQLGRPHRIFREQLSKRGQHTSTNRSHQGRQGSRHVHPVRNGMSIWKLKFFPRPPPVRSTLDQDFFFSLYFFLLISARRSQEPGSLWDPFLLPLPHVRMPKSFTGIGATVLSLRTANSRPNGKETTSMLKPYLTTSSTKTPF